MLPIHFHSLSDFPGQFLIDCHLFLICRFLFIQHFCLMFQIFCPQTVCLQLVFYFFTLFFQRTFFLRFGRPFCFLFCYPVLNLFPEKKWKCLPFFTGLLLQLRQIFFIFCKTARQDRTGVVTFTLSFVCLIPFCPGGRTTLLQFFFLVLQLFINLLIFSLLLGSHL